MAAATDKNILQQIRHSCYVTRSREGEQFIAEHSLAYQIAGTLIMNDGNREYLTEEGGFRLSRRNHLVKFVKQPPAHGPFEALAVYLDQQTLRNLSMEFGYKAQSQQNSDTIIPINPNPMLKSYMDSLAPYQDDAVIDPNLQALKVREGVLILLQTNPALKDVLFDFSEPGKIDLEGFMNKNFHFNVQLKRFAYLTGRSLATFKRDFEKTFQSTPNKWLQHRRLQEAHYLIKEKGKTASDVYLELGFEDLSHFSFAFKKTYGVSPSKIQ